MPSCIQLFIDGDAESIRQYSLLLSALDPEQVSVAVVADLAGADAVLLAPGGSCDEDLGPRPCLIDSRRSPAPPGGGCVGQLCPPLLDSLVEGLARLAQSRRPVQGPGSHGLVAHSQAMQAVAGQIEQVADKAVTVLINGPSGAGKELVAQAIHRLSPRSAGPFVPINCGAIPRDLLESELFGHEKGAFTGAISSRAGRFELADGGTLFLDEIGDMPLDMQVKILRAIQERSFERVGSSQSRSADVRIVAATHRDLPAMIAQGQFREDLYYRLNVFPIAVPALAARGEDIPFLVQDIVAQLAGDGLGSLRLSPAAIASLQAHPWPGNVRELANLLERLLIMYPDKLVGLGDLPEAYRHSQATWLLPAEPNTGPGTAAPDDSFPEQGINLKEELAALEQRRICQALAAGDGVVSRAAHLLELRRTTLIEKMRKYGIGAEA